MEIITATLPSMLEAKKHNGQEASEFISFPCFISCADRPSWASASWCLCGVGSLPHAPCLCCGWAWGCQQGQESVRRARHGGVRVGRLTTRWHLLGTSISICRSPHLMQRPSESNGHYFTSAFQISRMFLLWLTLNGIIQGKQCWETVPILTNLTEQSHLCSQEATLRKWALSWDPRMRMCQPQEGSRQELSDRGNDLSKGLDHVKNRK